MLQRCYKGVTRCYKAVLISWQTCMCVCVYVCACVCVCDYGRALPQHQHISHNSLHNTPQQHLAVDPVAADVTHLQHDVLDLFKRVTVMVLESNGYGVRE